MTRQFLSVASFKTASRCWVPIYSHQAKLRAFSSQQRAVNFNHEHETVSMVVNDEILEDEAKLSNMDTALFEPTVHSAEDVFTAGPVNKA